MIHPHSKIYCSIPTLFNEGVMRLDQLKAKAPREFNRRVKERPKLLVEQVQAKIESICGAEPSFDAEISLRHENLILYGTTHPEFVGEFNSFTSQAQHA